MLREVEDFAQRLNSDWPERMQILSLGQDRRLVTISMNSNGSTQLYTEASLNFGQSLLVLRYDYGLRARLAVTELLHMLIIFKDVLFHRA
ncbi:hypothetical protein JHK82_019205 [Glycine max]|nr:hypothetical protein JHK82_019205 [Glycine max]